MALFIATNHGEMAGLFINSAAHYSREGETTNITDINLQRISLRVTCWTHCLLVQRARNREHSCYKVLDGAWGRCLDLTKIVKGKYE